jgi:hypothetical protein
MGSQRLSDKKIRRIERQTDSVSLGAWTMPNRLDARGFDPASGALMGYVSTRLLNALKQAQAERLKNHR